MFQIQAEVPDPTPNYFQRVENVKKMTYNQSKIRIIQLLYNFKGTFYCIICKTNIIYLKFYFYLDLDTKQIIMDPGTRSGSNRIRIHNTEI